MQFLSTLFREIAVRLPPPLTLYEVNFILGVLDSNSSISGFFLVEDHLLHPYYKFQYPQVPVWCAVKRDDDQKIHETDLLLLR